MTRHYAIMLLCGVLAFAFYAFGLGMVSEVAIVVGLLFEGMFWVRVSQTPRQHWTFATKCWLHIFFAVPSKAH